MLKYMDMVGWGWTGKAHERTCAENVGKIALQVKQNPELLSGGKPNNVA